MDVHLKINKNRCLSDKETVLLYNNSDVKKHLLMVILQNTTENIIIKTKV